MHYKLGRVIYSINIIRHNSVYDNLTPEMIN